MNMISTGAFRTEMDASNKQSTLAEKFAAVWEKKNAKAARAGGVSLMALSLAACGSDSDTTTTTTSTTTTDTTTTDTTTTTTTVTPINTAFGVSSVDTITGTTADDTVRGDSADVTASDSFDGGDGNDTFTLNHTGEGAVGLPTLTNVENVIINEAVDTDEDNTGASVDAADSLGVTSWTLNDIDDDFAISNVDTGDTVTIIDNAGTTVDITVSYRAVTGTADAATINVDSFDATSDLIVADGLETLTVAAVGATTASTIAALDSSGTVTTLNLSATGKALTITEADNGGDNAVTTVNITGDAKVTVTNAMSTAVTTVDASASTGGATVSLSGLTGPTFTGGSGADTVTVITNDSVVNTGAGDDKVELNGVVLGTGTLNGGDGTDTLLINDASATVLTTATKARISNFETLEVEATTDTIDFNTLAGFTKLVVGTSTAADIDDLSSTVVAAGIDITGVQTTSLILEIDNAIDPGVANTMVLNLDHGTANTAVTVADFQAAGIETLTVNSNGAGTNTNSIELGTENTALTNVNIAGSSKFTLTVQGGADVGSTAVVVNGADATGVLTITLSGEDDGTNITGGSGADVIVGGTAVDIVSGGAGADNFTGSSGLDKYTGGAGVDDYDLTTATADATDMLTITDFARGAGGDTISLDESAVAGGIITGMTAGTTVYSEGTVGTVGTNDSSITLADNSIIVVTDQSFATYDLLEVELDIENGGTDLADIAVIFLNSTTGKAEMYADGVMGTTTTDEIKMVTFSDITTVAQLADFASDNFIIT